MNESTSKLARGITILAGIWLFISAFVLPHEFAMFTNTWVVGVAAVILAVIALRFPPVRFLNTLLAIWLFISAFAFPHVSNAPVWNNAIVAIVIFVMSLVPASTRPAVESGTPPDRTGIPPPREPRTV